MATNKQRRIERGATVLLAVASGTIATWIIQAPQPGEACTVDPNYYYSGGKLVSYPYVSCRTIQDRVYSNVTGCQSNIPYRECFREQVAISRQNINWATDRIRQRFNHWGQAAQAEPMIIHATDTNPPTAPNYISRPTTPYVPPYRQGLPMDFAPAEVRAYRPPVQQADAPVAPVVPRSTDSVVPRNRMSACRNDQRFCN